MGGGGGGGGLGHNELCGIRNQRDNWDDGSQAMGLGSAVFQGIRDQR